MKRKQFSWELSISFRSAQHTRPVWFVRAHRNLQQTDRPQDHCLFISEYSLAWMNCLPKVTCTPWPTTWRFAFVWRFAWVNVTQWPWERGFLEPSERHKTVVVVRIHEKRTCPFLQDKRCSKSRRPFSGKLFSPWKFWLQAKIQSSSVKKHTGSVVSNKCLEQVFNFTQQRTVNGSSDHNNQPKKENLRPETQLAQRTQLHPPPPWVLSVLSSPAPRLPRVRCNCEIKSHSIPTSNCLTLSSNHSFQPVVTVTAAQVSALSHLNYFHPLLSAETRKTSLYISIFVQ